MLLYTYISRFPVNPHYQQQFYLRPSFIAFFNFPHKRPTFAFAGESGYTLGFRRKIAHNGSHGETRGVSDGVVSLPSERSARFGNPARPGVRTANFAAFGSWSGGALEERRKPSGQRCAYARRCSAGVAAPLGCVILFRFCRNCGLYALRSGAFRVCEARGGITTLSALYVLLKHRIAACQKG